jgi:hypothetical protein
MSNPTSQNNGGQESIKDDVKEEIKRAEKGWPICIAEVITFVFIIAVIIGVVEKVLHPDWGWQYALWIKVASGVLAVWAVYLKIGNDERKNAIEALGAKSEYSQAQLEEYKHEHLSFREKLSTLVTFATGCFVILGLIFQ